MAQAGDLEDGTHNHNTEQHIPHSVENHSSAEKVCSTISPEKWSEINSYFSLIDLTLIKVSTKIKASKRASKTKTKNTPRMVRNEKLQIQSALQTNEVRNPSAVQHAGV
jgi:hypothetical protein